MLPQGVNTQQLGMVQLKAKFALDAGADTLSVPSFDAEIFGLRERRVAAATSRRPRAGPGAARRAILAAGLDPAVRPAAAADVGSQGPHARDGRQRFDEDANAPSSRVALALDDTKITGEFTLEGFDKPEYRFALVVDRVDADRYLPPKARTRKKGEATAGDIALPENNTMNLDGTMQIGDPELAGMQFQSVGSRI